MAGPDADRNGVRDDVDKYIDSLPDTDAQKTGLRQQVVAIAASLVADPTNISERYAVWRKISSAVECLHSEYESTVASKKGREMEN